MDKKTIIGLGIIGAILAIFTFFNQPTKEELQKRAEQQEQVSKEHEKVLKESEHTVSLDTISKNSSKDSLENITNVNDSTKTQKEDSTNILGITSSEKVKEQTFKLENNNITIILSNKGGGVKSVFLKKYQTYTNFIKNKGTKKIDPIQLFDENKATNSLDFNINGREINTSDIAFELSKQTDNYISFVAQLDSGKSIEQIYSIQPNRYDIDYEIKMNGFGNEVKPNQVYLNWKLDLLKTERLLTEQRRYSTVFYYENKGSYEYLSEHSDDEKTAEKDIEWVAFKQSYFSTILMPKKGFKKEGTTFKIANIPDGSRVTLLLLNPMLLQ